MQYKVNISINWTTELGYVILPKDEHRKVVKKLESMDPDEELLLTYCADGDDYYVSVEKKVSDLLQMFKKAKTVSESDLVRLEHLELSYGAGPATEVYEKLYEELFDDEEEE